MSTHMTGAFCTEELRLVKTLRPDGARLLELALLPVATIMLLKVKLGSWSD